MASILLIYKSKTGFTKKYVDWITESITCETISLEQIESVDINNYDIIIYGAGMHASRIQGIKKFKDKVMDLENKKIVVFITGASPCEEEIVSEVKKNNFSADELGKIKIFYFQSGLNYEKMGFGDKSIMKIYSTVLKFKNNKSDIEEGASKAILESYDYSSKEYIKPMVEYLNELINNIITEKV
ncbi:flavodoxin-like protein [Natranaerovirga pectinivora]|uniref:Flavodoxin-like protein n=1 Tax=Natranaerovirga pectinivora TaxID=682400 RepID=A0A4R3MFD4_9FIRM|nr:flavodoxin domain-containing protein [Natranaerovirga pectinivora]TCT12215.1 flavodoxin-like protein [Natranaerovirga pectinivora]